MAALPITVADATLYYGTEAEILATSGNQGDVGFATDTGSEYTCTADGANWLKTRSSAQGSAMVSASGTPSGLEKISIICNADTDCITTPSAPINAETATIVGWASGKKRCRVTFHSSGSGVPYSSGLLVSLNGGDTATDLVRISQPDNIVKIADYDQNDFKSCRESSAFSPVIEWDLNGTTATVDRVCLGFKLNDGTWDTTCIATVEVW